LPRRFVLLRLPQLLLQLHQGAVLQFCGAVQVVGAAGLLDLDLGLVDLPAQVGDLLQRLALAFPARAQGVPLLFQVGKLPLEILESLA
jgi:hypothetical protein